MYTDGSVTKDQSGWGFTAKQGATTIHEDSAAYTVSTSSLTKEVEAVTYTLRWIVSRGDCQTTRAIGVMDSTSLLQKVEWEARTGIRVNVRHSASKTIQSYHHKWIPSRTIWSVEELETLLAADTKPRTSQHRSPGGERLTRKRKHSTIILDRTREDHLEWN